MRRLYLILLPAFVSLAPAFARSEVDCAGALIALQSEEPAARETGARALAQCPPSSNVARLLEARIREDDAGVRAAAMQSFIQHRDRQSLSFLVQEYEAGRFRSEEMAWFYSQMLALVTPADRDSCAYILERGASMHRPVIRHAAIEALGRSRAVERWSTIERFLNGDDAGDRTAALSAARWMMNGAALPYALRSLQRSGAEQAAAIALLGDLGGPAAVQALARSLADAAQTNHRALIQIALRQLRERGQFPAESWLAAERTALYASPTERSESVAAIDRWTVLLPIEQRREDYRLPGPAGQPPYNGPWRNVRTLTGLSGWVHQSAIEPAPSLQ